MKKIIISILVVLVLGVAYWIISPFFIDREVSEAFPTQESGEVSQVVKTGEFVGFDKIHTGSGKVSLIQTAEGYVVRFEDDFAVANGPDLYVGFGKDGEYQKGTELGTLKGNIGSQNYVVPESISLDEYNEVWVWCKAFSVGFAKAKLD